MEIFESKQMFFDQIQSETAESEIITDSQTNEEKTSSEEVKNKSLPTTKTAESEIITDCQMNEEKM